MRRKSPLSGNLVLRTVSVALLFTGTAFAQHSAGHAGRTSGGPGLGAIGHARVSHATIGRPSVSYGGGLAGNHSYGGYSRGSGYTYRHNYGHPFGHLPGHTYGYGTGYASGYGYGGYGNLAGVGYGGPGYGGFGYGGFGFGFWTNPPIYEHNYRSVDRSDPKVVSYTYGYEPVHKPKYASDFLAEMAEAKGDSPAAATGVKRSGMGASSVLRSALEAPETISRTPYRDTHTGHDH